MERTLYLHVGDGRCGSSSIQRLGASQRHALLDRGVYYPAASDMGFDAEWDHGGNGRVLALAEDGDEAISLVANHLARSAAERFLISAEHLRTADADRLTSLADAMASKGIRVVAVLYLREQREWLVSNWAQGLKSRGWDMTLDNFLVEHAARGFTAPTLAYVGRTRRLHDIFGADNVIVRRFQRDAMEAGDVRADLMHLIGIDANDLIAVEPRINESASLEDAVMLRVLNSLPNRGLFDRRAFLRRCRELARRNEWPRRRDLYRLARPSTLQVTASHYADTNEEFRRTFLPQTPAPLFTSSIPDEYEQIAEDECIGANSLELVAEFYALVARGKVGQQASKG